MGLGIFLVVLYVILEIIINGISALKSSVIADPITFFILFLVVSLFFAAGYLLRLLVLNQAVTQRTIDYYEHALDDTKQGVSIIDRKYRINLQNGVITNLFGNAVGDICYAVYFGRNSPCEDCMLGDVIDRYKRFTTLRELHDGRIFKVILAPFMDSKGSIVVVEMMRDVTEEEVDENVLKKHRDHLDKLVRDHTAELAIANEQLKKEVLRRREYEEELKKHRDHLDELVRERTAELAIANEQLQAEIAERKQIEEKIIEKEKELRVITESSLDIIFAITTTGKFLYISPSAKEIFGYEADEMIGTYFTKYVPKQELPRYWKTLKEEVLRNKKVRSFRTYAKHRDGHLTPVEITGQLVRREGKLVAQGTMRDITERMQYEEELKKHRDHLDELVRERTAQLTAANEQLQASESEIKAIIENVSDIIFQLSPTGYIQYVSPNVEKLCGYKVEDLIGKYLTKTTPLNEVPRVLGVLKRVLSGEVIKNFELYQRDAHGALIPMEASLTPVKKDGRIIGLQGVMRDITERKEAEENLKAIFDSAPLGMMLANEDTEVVQLNHSVVEIAGKSPDQLIGLQPGDILSCKNAYNENGGCGKGAACGDCPVRAGMTEALETGGSMLDAELQIEHLVDGKLIKSWLSISVVPTIVHQRKQVVIAFIDITERKEGEKALKEAEELYRTIIDAGSTAKEGFALVQDIDGIEAKHVFVNDYYSELTGYSKQELYGMSCHEMIHPVIREEVVDRYRRKMAGEDLPSYNEFEWMKKNGEVLTVGLSSAVTIFKGKPAFLYYFRDITEEKKLKEEIKRERAFLTSVLSSMNDMVAIMDIDGNILRINHVAEEKLGFMNEDVTGLKFNEIDWLDERFRDEIESYFGEVAAGKNIEGCEITLITADGRSIPSLFSMSPIVDSSSSEVLGLVAQVIDISELKKFSNELLYQKEELVAMTAELESAKAYLETLIDTIPSALFTIDTEQHITLWNRAAEEITGYKKEEMLGKNCRILESADCSEICTFLDVATLKPVTGKECTIRSSSDNKMIISTNVNNLSDLSGNIIGVIVSFIDITARKEAAMIIEASEVKFRTLVENLHAGVFRSTLKGEYIEANPAMIEILGSLTKSELARSNVLDLLFAADVREEVCSRLREDGEITGYEVPIESVDGSGRRWFSVSMRCVDGRDAQYIDGIVEDVTRQKHYAEELEHEIEMATCELKNDKIELSKAFNELKELDKLKTQFFSNVSHELKTPLTVIKAHLHFLKTGKLGEMTEKMAKSVDVAAREAVDLEDLVGTILDLARLDSGAFKLDLVEAVITDVAEDLVDRMRKKAEEVGQNLVLEVDGEIPKRLFDPKRMKQVLMNLVSNSIKYNPEKTTTTIKIYTDSKNIVVDVTDDGVGIEKKDLEKIFDRFYQVDGSTTRSGSGTGIGLSIVKELVALHGGEITVESEVGAGSTFSVLLPVDWKA